MCVLTRGAHALSEWVFHAVSMLWQLHLGGRGIEILWGFDRFTNLETLWLNNNKVWHEGRGCRRLD